MKSINHSSVRIPKVLTIAGSDSGGGAGLQADLKVMTSLGVYGMTVVTAITAQNTLGVSKIQGIDLNVIEAQIDAVVNDIGVDAIKIGMLSSPDIVHCVAAALRRHAIKIIVLDPVLRATSGASLGGDETAHAMREALFPLATIITPNMEEASILLGRSVEEPDDFVQAAQDLLQMGPAAVLIKGGHLDQNQHGVDARRFGRPQHQQTGDQQGHDDGRDVDDANREVRCGNEAVHGPGGAGG